MSKGLDAFEFVQEKQMVDSDKKVKIGIIGAGWIAGVHVDNYKKMPDAEIVAVCDIIPGKAEKFCKEHGLDGAKCYDGGHTEMLADKSLELDAVSVCTYNRAHAKPTIDALDCGISVLLEKPMCVTLDEAVEICRAEKRNPGCVLSIGFQPRMDENMKMIKKIVDEGTLGKVYYIQTGGGRQRGIPTPFGTSFIEQETAGIGALGDIGCYSLDMVLNAVGYPKPLTVTGYSSAFFGTDPNYCNYVKSGHPEYAEKFGVDDFAAAFVRLEGDIILDFRIAWAMNIDTPGDTIILGTKGGLRVPSTGCWNGSVGGEMTIYHEIGNQQVQTKIPVLKTEEDLFYLKIRSFLDACKEGGKPPVPASEIIYNQAIIDGIFRSAQFGHEIEIQIPEI
jgi:predicted dehydrogenase